MPELVQTKTKLVFKDACNPKLLAQELETNPEITVASLFGIAERLTTRTMPTGEFYEGLSGEFEIRRERPLETKDSDGNTVNVSVIRSTVLFMPSSFHDAIAKRLKAEGAATVQFSANVIVKRDGNPQGFTWALNYVSEPDAADPLAALRQKHVANLAQIAAPQRARALPQPKAE